MRPAAFAVSLDPGALAEVDLQLIAGLALHPAKRRGDRLAPLPHKPFDRLVAAGEPVLSGQILEETPARQPGIQARLDYRAQRLAQALPAGYGPGGRNGRFWFGRSVGAGDRNGWF